MDPPTVAADAPRRQGTAAKRQNPVFRKRLKAARALPVPILSSQTPGSVLPRLPLADFLCGFGPQSERLGKENGPGCEPTLPWGW
ncbi:MAG: hypothetical protein ACK6AD_08440 [Cyanobacteriota bacterium]